MARSKKRRSRSRTRFWPALLGLVLAAGILASAYYGITRLLAGVVPATLSGIPGLMPVESDFSPAVQMTADSSTAYFSELPANYAFRITSNGIQAADLAALISLTGNDGNPVDYVAVKRQNGFDIQPASQKFSAGATYRITLSAPLAFAAENLQPYQTVYFSISRDDSQQMAYQRNVIELQPSDVLTWSETELTVRSGTCKSGNILLLPSAVTGRSAPIALLAESVNETAGGLRVTVQEPALTDIFRELDVHGRFALQISQAEIKATQRPGLQVVDQSGGNTLKFQATVSPFGDTGPRLIVTYEDQPEFILNLQADGSLAFGLASNGKTHLTYELTPDGINGLSPETDRAAIISRLQTALASEPDLLAENITLFEAALTPADFPLAIKLNILLDLEAAFKGSLSGQLSENLNGTAGARLFASQVVAYGSSDTGSLTANLRQLGNSRLNSAITSQAQLQLLQFTAVTLNTRHNWETSSAGFIGAEDRIWGSLPGQEPSGLTLGLYNASGTSRISGSLASRLGDQSVRSDDFLCFSGEPANLGPWGAQQIPISLSSTEPIEFDETMTAAALTGISLQALDLSTNQLVAGLIDPAGILVLLDRSQLFVTDGQLQLPAGLALGEHTAAISLPALPDVKGSLILRKIKPVLSADLRLIAELLTLKKADAIARLGAGYTRVAAGADGWLDGYQYSDRGLTLCFYPAGMQPDPANGITADDLDRTVMIYCDNKIDINDARVGMNPQQIKAILGEPAAFYPASEYFMLDVNSYEIQGLQIKFAGSGDGAATDYAFISRLKSAG